MRPHFLHKGAKLFVRRFTVSHDPTSETRELRARIEASHFYEVLASRPEYYIGKVNKVQVEDAPGSVQDFLNASLDTLDKNIISDIAYKAPEFSLTTLKALLLKLHSWVLTGNGRTAINMCFPVTSALIRRAQVLMESEQSLELEFTLADLFYRVHKVSPFARAMTARQSTALRYLSETDFLQHLFFSIPTRSLQPDTRAAMPSFVDNVIHKLDVEEVGIFCFAAFSGQYHLPRVDQCVKIAEALEKHQGPISDVTMGIFAKYLRYVSPVRASECDHLRKLLDVGAQRRSEWSLSTHLRIANAGSQASVCNEVLVRSAVPKVMKSLDTCRLKDLATCLFINAYYDFKIDPNDAEAIIKRLKNENPEPKHHAPLVKATFALVVMGYYDEQLLIKSLDRGIIDFETTHRRSGFEAYTLFTAVSILFPHLLKDKILLKKEDMQAVIDKITDYESASKRFTVDLENVITLLDRNFHVSPRTERTLDLFSQPDLRIGKNLVIVLNTVRFYLKGGHLKGLRRFQVDLLKAAKYDVIVLNKEFFEMTEREQVRAMQSALAGYVT